MMTPNELRGWYEHVQGVDPFSQMTMDEISDPEHVRRLLEAELTRSLRAHEGGEALEERIRRVVDVSAARAQTIARTEKTRAQSVGRLRAMLEPYFKAYDKAVKQHRKRPERPWHEWVEPMAAKVPRHDHISLSGRKVPVGEVFGFGLRIPADPDAPIEQTANCHCYTRRCKGGGNYG